jgi:zinc-binding alcohol dehydrogenase family protein
MRAVGYHAPGGLDRPDALVDLEVAPPVPRARDLIVRVKAVAVNPVDTKIRKSAQPSAGETRILGWDAAGIVETVGEGVTLFRPGDEVFYAGALNRPGSNAELQAVDERLVGHKPASVDWAEAAALPLTTLTAWELLFDRLRVPFGSKRAKGSILILGGGGGVGSILTQLARRLTGLTVIATASRPETAAWVRNMGAHHVIDHHEPLDRQLAAMGIAEVDYVASLTGSAEQLAVLPGIIVPQGQLALIDDPETFDVTGFKRKSIGIAWESMFTRSTFETGDMIAQHEILEEVAQLVDAGVLRTTLTTRETQLNAVSLRRAHARLESGTTIGKIVLAGF